MISAMEARQLMGVHEQTVNNVLILCDEVITKAAKNGQSGVQVFHDCLNRGESSPTVIKIIHILKDQRFNVKFNNGLDARCCLHITWG